jgi:hypothetical protein
MYCISVQLGRAFPYSGCAVGWCCLLTMVPQWFMRVHGAPMVRYLWNPAQRDVWSMYISVPVGRASLLRLCGGGGAAFSQWFPCGSLRPASRGAISWNWHNAMYDDVLHLPGAGRTYSGCAVGGYASVQVCCTTVLPERRLRHGDRGQSERAYLTPGTRLLAGLCCGGTSPICRCAAETVGCSGGDAGNGNVAVWKDVDGIMRHSQLFATRIATCSASPAPSPASGDSGDAPFTIWWFTTRVVCQG